MVEVIGYSIDTVLIYETTEERENDYYIPFKFSGNTSSFLRIDPVKTFDVDSDISSMFTPERSFQQKFYKNNDLGFSRDSFNSLEMTKVQSSLLNEVPQFLDMPSIRLQGNAAIGREMEKAVNAVNLSGKYGFVRKADLTTGLIDSGIKGAKSLITPQIPLLSRASVLLKSMVQSIPLITKLFITERIEAAEGEVLKLPGIVIHYRKTKREEERTYDYYGRLSAQRSRTRRNYEANVAEFEEKEFIYNALGQILFEIVFNLRVGVKKDEPSGVVVPPYRILPGIRDFLRDGIRSVDDTTGPVFDLTGRLLKDLKKNIDAEGWRWYNPTDRGHYIPDDIREYDYRDIFTNPAVDPVQEMGVESMRLLGTEFSEDGFAGPGGEVFNNNLQELDSIQSTLENVSDSFGLSGVENMYNSAGVFDEGFYGTGNMGQQQQISNFSNMGMPGGWGGFGPGNDFDGNSPSYEPEETAGQSLKELDSNAAVSPLNDAGFGLELNEVQEGVKVAASSYAVGEINTVNLEAQGRRDLTSRDAALSKYSDVTANASAVDQQILDKSFEHLVDQKNYIPLINPVQFTLSEGLLLLAYDLAGIIYDPFYFSADDEEAKEEYQTSDMFEWTRTVRRYVYDLFGRTLKEISAAVSSEDPGIVKVTETLYEYGGLGEIVRSIRSTWEYGVSYDVTSTIADTFVTETTDYLEDAAWEAAVSAAGLTGGSVRGAFEQGLFEPEALTAHDIETGEDENITGIDNYRGIQKSTLDNEMSKIVRKGQISLEEMGPGRSMYGFYIEDKTEPFPGDTAETDKAVSPWEAIIRQGRSLSSESFSMSDGEAFTNYFKQYLTQSIIDKFLFLKLCDISLVITPGSGPLGRQSTVIIVGPFFFPFCFPVVNYNSGKL